MSESGRSARAVGRVAAIYRYAVKSMRGEAIAAASVGWRGLVGDRRYAFVRGDDHSGFPWLTGRQIPRMVRYAPYLINPDDPAGSPVVVRTPDGRDLPVDDDELLEELASAYRASISLIQLKIGAFDSAAISLIGVATVEALGAAAGRTLDPRRFRPNLVVEALDGQPFAEEQWLDRLLIVGDRPDAARIRANRKDDRCMMINLDPETAVQQPEVLRTVVQTRDECAGIYGSVEAPGTIAVGDVIQLVAE